MENGKGTILIADISGYSNFVKRINSRSGARVIAKLLESIIRAFTLPFKISEIEGDAILFYNFENPYPVNTILTQFENMLKAFNGQVEILQDKYPEVADLSIKLIVHYGDIETFSVRGFSKLYGKTVIEAHRLLKNNTGLKTYTLFTDEYVRVSDNIIYDSNRFELKIQHCEVYEGIDKLCYTYYTFNKDPISQAMNIGQDLVLPH